MPQSIGLPAGSQQVSHDSTSATAPTMPSFFQQAYHMLLELLGMEGGSQLNSTALWNAQLNIFQPSSGWNPTIKNRFDTGSVTDEGETAMRPMWLAKQQGEEATVLLSAPCHDVLNVDDAMRCAPAGNLPVATALKAMCQEYPTGEVHALLPVGQQNDFFGNRRGHYVLLEVLIRDGQVQLMNLNDSKGMLSPSSLYQGMTQIQAQLAHTNSTWILSDQLQVNTTYCGHQAMLNSYDCGRFALYYAEQLARNEQPLDLKTIPTQTARNAIAAEKFHPSLA